MKRKVLSHILNLWTLGLLARPELKIALYHAITTGNEDPVACVDFGIARYDALRKGGLVG